MNEMRCHQELPCRKWCREVSRAFSDLTGTHYPANSFSWNVSFGNGDGTGFESMAVIERHEWWLHLGTSLQKGKLPARSVKKQAWQLLKLNAALPGGVKFAAGNGCRSPVIRADIPLVGGNGFLPQRIKIAFEGFLRARTAGLNGSKTEAAESAPPPDGACPNPEATAAELLSLCRGAGWECDEQESGVLVKLDTTRDIYRAELTALPEGGLRAMVRLTSDEEWADPCREALSMMYLRLNAVVPMVRAVITETAEKVKTGLEVIFPRGVQVNELDRGLAALSDACGLYGKEVKILRDKSLAGQYLAVRR